MRSTPAGASDADSIGSPGPDVVKAAESLRWLRPDLTSALADHVLAEAAADGDRDRWLAAAGWAVHARSATGDGRMVASEILGGLARWGSAALAAPSAHRLRVELAGLAAAAGQARGGRRLLEPVIAAGAHSALQADAYCALARCAVEDRPADVPDALRRAGAIWAELDGPRGGFGTASVALVAAVAERRAGRPAEAVLRAVEGLVRLAGVAGRGTRPQSGHLAAALATEWISALLDVGRSEEAGRAGLPVGTQFADEHAPIATGPGPCGGTEGPQHTASDPVEIEASDLDAVCRSMVAALYESRSRMEDDLDTRRFGTVAQERDRSRDAAFVAALRAAAAFEPYVTTTGAASDPERGHGRAHVATSDRDGPSTWPDGIWSAVPSSPVGVQPPPAWAPDENELVERSTAVRDGRDERHQPDTAEPAGGPFVARSGGGRHAADHESADEAHGAAGSGPGNQGLRRAVGMPDDRRLDSLSWLAGAVDDPLGLARWDGPAGGAPTGEATAGVETAAVPAAGVEVVAVPAAGVEAAADANGGDTLTKTSSGAASSAADPSTAAALPADSVRASDPVWSAGTEPNDPTTRRYPAPAPPVDPGTDGWLQVALAEPDRIWGAAVTEPAGVQVADLPPTAPQAKGCIVVIDVARAGRRFAGRRAGVIVRAVAERLADRLPVGAGLRDESGALSVVVPGWTRPAATEWMHLTLPEMLAGVEPSDDLPGAHLRAAVHDADEPVGAQILQRIDRGARRPAAGPADGLDGPAAGHSRAAGRAGAGWAGDSSSGDSISIPGSGWVHRGAGPSGAGTTATETTGAGAETGDVAPADTEADATTGIGGVGGRRHPADLPPSPGGGRHDAAGRVPFQLGGMQVPPGSGGRRHRHGPDARQPAPAGTAAGSGPPSEAPSSTDGLGLADLLAAALAAYRGI